MFSFRRRFILLFWSIATFSSATISAGNNPDNLIRLATTTSTENSGLMDVLLPAFESAHGYQVHLISVGTGKALRLGKDGDVDALLVHAPTAEKAFMAAGFGSKRESVMHNDFVLVGPPDDPAGINQASTLPGAMQSLATSSALFISRGDDSGTHKKELALWKSAAIKPKQDQYREAGQGMGKVLQIADQLNAYTLTDRGTWLSYQGRLSLKLLFERDPVLNNPYSIIEINSQRHPHTNSAGAQALVAWIISAPAQQLINQFRIREQQLFIPDRL